MAETAYGQEYACVIYAAHASFDAIANSICRIAQKELVAGLRNNVG